jgi:hypothetical protein
MIRNGLYFYSSKALDGVVGGADGVMVLRDGKMLGGTYSSTSLAPTVVPAENGKVN